MSKSKNITLWVTAFVLMAVIAIYQRMTGPTYPVSGEINISGEQVDFSLPRSQETSNNASIKIEVPEGIEGKIKYKRYPSHDDWTVVAMEETFEQDPEAKNIRYLVTDLPILQSAGKFMYEIFLTDGSGEKMITKEPVILRYKDPVPDYFLIPHIIIMFSAMWFSMRTGFEALAKGDNIMIYTIWTTILLFVGGIIMGPIIQKYAFGEYWTGWPFGHDLTDNKTLAAFIMWIIAVWRTIKNKDARWWPVAAAIVTLAVYLVPHSVLGSEIDYTQVPQ